jgi:hypothetical protein
MAVGREVHAKEAQMTTLSATLPLEEAPRTALGALRDPERFLRAWNDHGRRAYSPWVFVLLVAVAALGTAGYGFAIGLPFGWRAALERALGLSVAAGSAWALALPTFYILGSLSGMRLRFTTTLLAAILTKHYAALALLASIPIQLLFSTLLPFETVRLAVHIAVFAGVGICAADVLVRVVREVEPESVPVAKAWLLLLGALGPELFYLLGVFQPAA